MILSPKSDQGLAIYVDADFAGNWDPKETQDRDTARSRHGYIAMYAGCPIMWKSQLQGEITLSSTESEYTGMSYALRDGIPLMHMLREFAKHGLLVGDTTPTIHCEVFEDNSGALEIATNHKYRPRTKHLNVKLHHFRDYVTQKEILIKSIGTLEQPADYLTQAVNEPILRKHRMFLQGW